ncbi:uncharacterized protein LOC141915498 isoform X3 [Tubulanus polymorphus]|uniref:uncharacterized protein LOC141915498 isoform X3 n=1 Tax=Tubulanus polymorphus TaxID=672921 RepID=UPI003DA67329
MATLRFHLMRMIVYLLQSAEDSLRKPSTFLCVPKYRTDVKKMVPLLFLKLTLISLIFPAMATEFMLTEWSCCNFCRRNFLSITIHTRSFATHHILYLECILEAVRNKMAQNLYMPFRSLRAFLMICRSRSISHICDVALDVILKVGKVIIVIWIFILVFAAVGVHVYSIHYHFPANRTEHNIYHGNFDHVGYGILRLFALLTTENYPAFMMPAYGANTLNFFFFGIFLYAGVFFLLAILLAIIVDNYWKLSKRHVKEERKRDRIELAKAWNILDPNGVGFISLQDETIEKVLRLVKPELKDENIEVIMMYLDGDSDGKIETYEWCTRLTDALLFNFEDVSTETSQRQIFGSPIKENIASIVFGDVFLRIILLLIMLHTTLFMVHWYSIDSSTELVIHSLKTLVVCIFMVEGILRQVGSTSCILRENWIELMDFVFSCIAFAFNAMWYIHFGITWTNVYLFKGVTATVSALAVLFRLSANSQATKRGMNIFRKISPIMFDINYIVWSIIYFYAVIGMEAFSDSTLKIGNYSSEHIETGCGVGFDTFPCSLLTVFQIVTTSNWHEIMNVVMLSISPWTAIYFVTCFVIIDMVIMNLVVAIAIEAYKKLTTKLDDSIDDKIEPNWVSQTQRFKNGARRFLGTVLQSSRSPSIVTLPEIEHPLAQMSRKLSSTLEVCFCPVKEEEILGLASKLSFNEKLKHRMQKHRELRGTTLYKVTIPYRMKSYGEIDLHYGDKVEVLEKNGNFWRGICGNGRCGWFPAKCLDVIAVGGGGGALKNVSERTLVQEAVTKHSTTMNRQIKQSRPSLKHRPSSIRKKSGPWRKDILGKITVMNQDEILELNAIVKGTIRDRTRETMRRIPRLIHGLPSNKPRMKTSDSLNAEHENGGETSFAVKTHNLSVHHSADEPKSPIKIEVLPSSDCDEDPSDEEVNRETLSLGTCKSRLSVQKPRRHIKRRYNKPGSSNVPNWVSHFISNTQGELKIGSQTADDV